MAADQDCAVPACILLWLRLLGSSGKRNETQVVDLLQSAKRALEVREHTARERELVSASHLLAAGDLEQTRLAVERCLVLAPNDAMLLKFQTDICLLGGFPQEMRDAVERSLPYMDPAKTPMFSYVLGMYAFSLEESGDTRAGIAMAKSALEYNRRDAWALHALSHALDAEGRVGELLELLHRTEPEWAQVCPYLYFCTLEKRVNY